MRPPLAIDLFCGLGGWTEGLLVTGYRVVGFDIERHVYGAHSYPAQLVLQDVRTIHGRQFRHAALIVASPPCQEYSYMAMPWSKAKQRIREYEDGTRDVRDLTALFDACFRIQREACEAAGRHIPLVVENVRGAQRWVGRSRWHFGSFHLWGDVPALMPIARGRMKAAVTHRPNDAPFLEFRPGRKVATMGAGWYPPGHPKHAEAGVKHWFNSSQPFISRLSGSKSPARKAASALIAKIPLVLSRHIAAAWHPEATA